MSSSAPAPASTSTSTNSSSSPSPSLNVNPSSNSRANLKATLEANMANLKEAVSMLQQHQRSTSSTAPISSSNTGSASTTTTTTNSKSNDASSLNGVAPPPAASSSSSSSSNRLAKIMESVGKRKESTENKEAEIEGKGEGKEEEGVKHHNLKETSNREEALEKDLRKLRAENQLLRELIEEVRAQIASDSKRFSRIEKENEELKSRAQAAEERAESLASQLSDLSENHQEPSQAFSQQQSTGQQSTEQASIDQNQEQAEKISKLEARIKELEATNADLQGKIERSTSHHSHMDVDIDSMKLSELKSFITSRGLRYDDCFEKSELVGRAHEAAKLPVRRLSSQATSTYGFDGRFSPRHSMAREGSFYGGAGGGINSFRSLDGSGTADTSTGEAHEETHSPGYGEEIPQRIPPGNYQPPSETMYFKEGWLTKIPSTGTMKNWRKWPQRFFVLTNRGFLYFKDPSHYVPQGVVDLEEASVEAAERKKPGDECKLIIRTPVRTFYLIAEDEEEMNSWFDRIFNAISAIAEFRYFERQRLAGSTGVFDDTKIHPEADDEDKPEIATSNNNLYALLGISKEATQEQIRDAYKEKASAVHPDSNPDADPIEFQRLRYAWSILGDPDTREDYDLINHTRSLLRSGFACVEHVRRYAITAPQICNGGSSTICAKERLTLFYCDWDLRRIFWQPAVAWESPRGYLLADSARLLDIYEVKRGWEPSEQKKHNLEANRSRSCVVIYFKQEQWQGSPSLSISKAKSTVIPLIIELESPYAALEMLRGLRLLLEEMSTEFADHLEEVVENEDPDIDEGLYEDEEEEGEEEEGEEEEEEQEQEEKEEEEEGEGEGEEAEEAEEVDEAVDEEQGEEQGEHEGEDTGENAGEHAGESEETYTDGNTEEGQEYERGREGTQEYQEKGHEEEQQGDEERAQAQGSSSGGQYSDGPSQFSTSEEEESRER